MRIVANKSGFSLIEVLIAITVLTIVIVSASSFLASLSRSNKLAAEVLQATYLAQEGLEQMRNLRDDNWDAGRDWDAGLEKIEVGICKQGDGFLTACDLFHTNTTQFSRKIEVADFCNEKSDDYCENAKLIKSTVYFGDSEVVLKMVLSNWNQ